MNFVFHHRTMGRSSQAMHIRGMVEALRADGHDVVIVSPPGVDPWKAAGAMPFLRKQDRARGVQRVWKYVSRECPQIVFELFELLYNLLLPFRLLPVMLRRKNAVLYERHAYFMFMGVLLGNCLGRTVVLEVNEIAGFKRVRGLVLERLARRIDAWVFAHVDHILCVSSVLAAEVQKRGGVAERIHVVPNAIDPERFRDSGSREPFRQRLGVNGSIVVGHVGLFCEWDRLDVLIEVVSGIRERYPSVKLLLVGDGPEAERLKTTAVRLEMESTLILSGPVHRDDVPAYIDAMDICVLPDSNVFGSPIALFEFMAMGKPSVVPDLGPMLDVIENDVTGIVFPHADCGALKASILRLMDDPGLRTQIGKRAKDRAFERHTWPANARFVVQLVSGKDSASRFPAVIQIESKSQHSEKGAECH